MPSLKKMKKMNYAEALEFFMENERMGSPEATDYLKYISRKSFVYDMRGKEITSDGIYEGGLAQARVLLLKKSAKNSLKQSK